MIVCLKNWLDFAAAVEIGGTEVKKKLLWQLQAKGNYLGRTQLTNTNEGKIILFITFTVAWVEIMYIILKAVKSTLLKVNFVEIFVTIVSVIILVIHG